MGVLGDFIIKSVTRTTGPVANRASTLDHEARYNTVKRKAIVKPLPREGHEVVDCPRNITGKQLQHQVPLFRFNGSVGFRPFRHRGYYYCCDDDGNKHTQPD